MALSTFFPYEMSTDLQTQKTVLRESARARRQDISAERRLYAGEQIARNFLDSFSLESGHIVAGYWAMDGEADVFLLLEKLEDSGYSLCLPVVVEKKAPLLFRRWVPGAELVAGAHNTRHPPADEDSPDVIPDMVLVPLLAYDARGWRLGFGAGYYDRTLAYLRQKKRITAVGVGYSDQAFPEIPHGPHDQRLDAVITEEGVIRTA